MEFSRDDFVQARKYFGRALEILKSVYEKETQADEGAAGNIGILMFEIAKTFEFVGDFKEAIPRHEEALAFMSGRSDALNIASQFHHIAFCYCNSNRIEEGLDYCYRAIDAFAQVGQFEYLVNSISDLGRLVEKHSHIINFSKIEEPFLQLALENVTQQIERFQSQVGRNNSITRNIENIPYPIVSRLILLVFLPGFHHTQLSYVIGPHRCTKRCQ